jgi:hypothetical protein
VTIDTEFVQGVEIHIFGIKSATSNPIITRFSNESLHEFFIWLVFVSLKYSYLRQIMGSCSTTNLCDQQIERKTPLAIELAVR